MIGRSVNRQRLAQHTQAGQVPVKHGQRQILHFERDLVIIARHAHNREEDVYKRQLYQLS